MNFLTFFFFFLWKVTFWKPVQPEDSRGELDLPEDGLPKIKEWILDITISESLHEEGWRCLSLSLNVEGPQVAGVDMCLIPKCFTLQMKPAFSPKLSHWRKMEKQPGSTSLPVPFDRLSKQISPHANVHSPLSKLISVLCFCHLQVIWWHFQKKQEVWTPSGTGRDFLCWNHTESKDLVH